MGFAIKKLYADELTSADMSHLYAFMSVYFL